MHFYHERRKNSKLFKSNQSIFHHEDIAGHEEQKPNHKDY